MVCVGVCVSALHRIGLRQSSARPLQGCPSTHPTPHSTSRPPRSLTPCWNATRKTRCPSFGAPATTRSTPSTVVFGYVVVRGKGGWNGKEESTTLLWLCTAMSTCMHARASFPAPVLEYVQGLFTSHPHIHSLTQSLPTTSHQKPSRWRRRTGGAPTWPRHPGTTGPGPRSCSKRKPNCREKGERRRAPEALFFRV